MTPRMIMWPAPDDLAPYISGYHLYVVGENDREPHRGAFEPAWASLRIVLTEDSEWRVRSGNGKWLSPPPVSLFGPSSLVTWSESQAGILIGAGIRPRGWLRLFAAPACDWADRIDEAPALGIMTPAAIRDEFRKTPHDDAVPCLFNALFRRVLRPPSAADKAIARIEAALVDPAIETVDALTQSTVLHVRRLERLALRAFGFPPKLLLRRARFLRSLHALRATGRGGGSTAIDLAYTDYSHFIRDSHDFLGMSPQAFLETDMPLLRRSLELRKAVLGTPAQALDCAPGVDPSH
ncbi:MAG: helix-turn-helix domain-containing protein [Novosphingobium sp.]|nr:helix-turn-helix domain-containing protein [Novosphingobium sp.]